jgi:hypothetical protein
MVFNGYGAIMMICGLVAAFLTGFLVNLTTNKPDKDVLIGGLVFLAITVGGDLYFRWKNNRERGRARYFHPKTGGTFWFIPLWLFFSGMMLAAMIWAIVQILTKTGWL